MRQWFNEVLVVSATLTSFVMARSLDYLVNRVGLKALGIPLL